MIQHIVMFKFKETANGKTKAENLREAKARMMALKDQIPQIQGMEVYFGAEEAPPPTTIISWSPSSRTWKS